MTPTPQNADAVAEAGAWAARAPQVPRAWFVRSSRLHGAHHTQRVHINAQRLTSELRWSDADTRLVLSAALWHDIGRTNDGEDPRHGAQSAARVLELGLHEVLAADDADLVLFAITQHCLSDEGARQAAERQVAGLLAEPRHAAAGRDDLRSADGARHLAEPERALRILWLLKDADALDRVRLTPWEAADQRRLRHPETIGLLPFAEALYKIIGRG
jgi:HD superfamily phosphodiesterase